MVPRRGPRRACTIFLHRAARRNRDSDRTGNVALALHVAADIAACLARGRVRSFRLVRPATTSKKEADMHAIVVRVNIDDPEAATGRLREDVVPRVSKAPGFIAGYWTRKDSTGLSMLVFESEEAATNAEERVRANMPEGVNLESSEVREVVASA
jgi:hypothetical protein